MCSCFWCGRDFVDGEMMTLAGRVDHLNVVLCQECADMVLAARMGKQSDRVTVVGYTFEKKGDLWYGTDEYGNTFHASRLISEAPLVGDDFLDTLLSSEKENAELRDAFEWATRQVWEGCDIDGGGFQDEMVKRGLLVEVPADDAFIEEFDAEFMYVLRWSPLAASCQKEIHE